MITIYYVEDDLDIAENVKTHLETRQMEVSVFYSIADAKQALLKKRPALITVKHNLPGSQKSADFPLETFSSFFKEL